MGSRYLEELADVCRYAGLIVYEVDGWQHRARSSGGYDSGRPTHVMVHHTASNPSSDPDGDVQYIAFNADAAPLSNLYLSRSGEVWVIAGGATNTNGSGSAPWPGGCPVDQMNTHAIGIEAASQGTGEVWPYEQQTAYLDLCAALCAEYGIAVGCVRGHAEYAPGRKIDPAGSSMYATGSATWNMELYRTDVSDVLVPEPEPEPRPPTGDDDMPAYGPYLIQATGKDGNPVGTVYALDRQFMTARALPDEEALAGYRWQLREAGATAPELVDGAPIMPVDTIAAFGVVISGKT